MQKRGSRIGLRDSVYQKDRFESLPDLFEAEADLCFQSSELTEARQHDQKRHNTYAQANSSF